MIPTKKQKSVPQLLKELTRHFNAYIRNRDKGKPCISCGNYTTLQCGHFYSAGHFSQLRFDELNCAGQCEKCNYFLSGNLLKYRENLEKRIGEEAVKDLERKSKMRGHRWDRYTLEVKIAEYKQKNKEINKAA